MINSTDISYFTLDAYVNTGIFRNLFVLIIMLLYLLIICANLFLIVVICMNRSLHEPMYMFLCSLFVNELYGSTGLFPFLLIQMFSDVHTISVSLCFLQIFCVYTYGNIQFVNLAVMSYDRYLAICCPLQYHARMTSNKVVILTALTWLCPFIEVTVMICLSATLQLCGNLINKVYCDNFSIVKLACYDTTVNNVYGVMYTIALILGVAIMIFYTYIKILTVCFSGSKQTRQKAVSTCIPQLISLFNFSFGCFFEIMQSRFNMSSTPNKLRIFLSLYFLTCQPLFNPVLYGLMMSKIRTLSKYLLFHKR